LDNLSKSTSPPDLSELLTAIEEAQKEAQTGVTISKETIQKFRRIFAHLSTHFREDGLDPLPTDDDNMIREILAYKHYIIEKHM